MLADHRESPDRRAFADPGSLGNGGLGMNPRRGPRWLIEQSQRAREVVIGIAGDQAGRLVSSNASGNQDRGGLRVAQFRRVLGVGEESNLSGARLFHPRDAGDFDIRVAPKFAAQPGRKIAQKDALHGGHKDGFIVSG